MRKEDKNTGAICGGVVNETLFFSDPGLYAMAFVMPDDKFEQYVKANEIGRKLLFKKHAYSTI